MCKVIGIYGKRGSGRKTAAWLIAKTLEEQRRGTKFEKYKALFECWVKLVIIDPAEATSTDHVILESFGEYIVSSVKQFCPVLTPYDIMGADKDAYLINPETFDITCCPDEDSSIVTADGFKELKEQLHPIFPSNCWMTLGEFVMYYAKMVIKENFGSRVWCNMMDATASLMDTEDIRIYWDVKTQDEIRYIDKKNGMLIELINEVRGRNGGYREISHLDPDIELDTTQGLEKCALSFWDIAMEIKNTNK